MCRDKDRAYEQNNNKDLDNGVFNKKEEEEDNLDGQKELPNKAEESDEAIVIKQRD